VGDDRAIRIPDGIDLAFDPNRINNDGNTLVFTCETPFEPAGKPSPASLTVERLASFLKGFALKWDFGFERTNQFVRSNTQEMKSIDQTLSESTFA
jgi:hypothetical protein